MYRCHFSQVFVDEADYGYGAFNGERYNVFKEFTATRTIIDERESLWDLLGGIHGMVIADKGLIGADDQNELRRCTNIFLQTALRSNMEENRSPTFLKWHVSRRRLVETVIGQLTDRDNIEKVRARQLWYLTKRIARKVLAYTICICINKKTSNPPL